MALNLRALAKRALWSVRPEPQEFSIGILSVSGALDCSPLNGNMKLALNKHSVSDVPAAFVADPFMCKVDQTWYMFFEVLNRRRWLGEIGLASSRDGHHWDYDKIVLRQPYHLSYPNIFEWEGCFYMIPETWQSGQVQLYQAAPFPEKWQFVRTLLDGKPYLDNSVFRHKDRWWMFTSSPRLGGGNSLHLFGADELNDAWEEHPASPIIENDCMYARSAGRVVVTENRILRFSQSSIPKYGTDVRVIEVSELSKSIYREEIICREPILSAGDQTWCSDGMHHIDLHYIGEDSWLACVDGWRAAKRDVSNLLWTLHYPPPKIGPGEIEKTTSLT